MRKLVFVTFASSALMMVPVSVVHAADATWVGGTPAPAGSDYGAAANWTPAGPPDGTATFGASANTNIFAASAFNLDGWTFNPGASDYTFTLNNGSGRVDFFGTGITINGGSASIINNNVMFFHNSSTAGSATITSAGLLIFDNASTAGSATITNNFILTFSDTSTAGSAAIINNSFGDGLNFRNTSTAGNATITDNGQSNFHDLSTAGDATITHNGNGSVNFRETSTAGNASITIKDNGSLNFFNASTAGNATITTLGTSDVQFNDSSSAGSATISGNAARFFGTSTAGNATITSTGNSLFGDSSSAGSATITNNGNGSLQFSNTSTAGSAVITNNGNSVQFFDASTAENAAITNNTLLQFFGTSTAGNATITNASPSARTDFSATTGPNGDGKISAASIAGSGDFFLGANQLTLGSTNLSSAVSGSISDCGASVIHCVSTGASGGSLVKAGTGTLTLSGVNTYTGATIVDAGILAVNGSIAASSLTTVNANAALTGTGTVGATQINAGGTFAPGNGAPGSSMTVSSLAFQSGAQYLVQLNPATSSFTVVTGAATLGGATVNATYASGGYVARRYTLLTAGSVSGAFDSVTVNTNLPSGFRSSLSYDATHAFLDLTLNFQPPLSPTFGGGLNVNQQNVANALTNFFNSTGGIPIVFGSLTPAGLTQASGETVTGTQQTTFDAMTQFMAVMTDPLLGGRGDGPLPGSGATSFAEEGNASAFDGRKRAVSERDAYGMITKASPRNPVFDPRWSVWAAGFGGSQTTDGNTALGSNATTSRLGAVAVGADYRLSPNTIAGFALAGGGTNFSVANGGSGRSDLFQAGAFIRHTVGPAYVSAAAAYGWQDITTDRTMTIAGIDRLRARFSANAWSGRIEGGYRFATPWMGGIGLTPYAAGQFTTFDLPAYAEQTVAGVDTFALAYGAKSVTASRSELGLRSDKSWAMPDTVFIVRGRAAWAHDYNTDRSIAATFQTLPGAAFVVNGAVPAQDTALATASAEMKWRNGLSLSATFEGEFSDVTRSYAGKGVARYAW